MMLQPFRINSTEMLLHNYTVAYLEKSHVKRQNFQNVTSSVTSLH